MSVNTRNSKLKTSNGVQSPSLSVRSESDCKLNELSTMLLDRMSEMESRIMEKISLISAEISNLRSDMKAVLVRVDVVENKLRGVTDDVLSLKNRISTLENNAIAADCIIYNVPNNAEADVVVKRAFAALECHDIQPTKVFRTLNNRNSSPRKSSPIIFKLKSSDDRVKLFKALAAYRRKNKKNLMLSDVGFGGNVHLSIFESLTLENRVILNAALSLKKNNTIYAAFSMRGRVYIRVRENDKAVIITDLARLQTIAGTTNV